MRLSSCTYVAGFLTPGSLTEHEADSKMAEPSSMLGAPYHRSYFSVYKFLVYRESFSGDIRRSTVIRAGPVLAIAPIWASGAFGVLIGRAEATPVQGC